MNLLRSLLFLSCTMLLGQNPTSGPKIPVGDEVPCSSTNSVFAAGERIVYKIYYN